MPDRQAVLPPCDMWNFIAGLRGDSNQIDPEAFRRSETSRDHRAEQAARGVDRLTIVRGPLAGPAAQRVRRGVDRRQPDHLGREKGIPFEQVVLAAPRAMSSATMCTGTRARRNTG